MKLFEPLDVISPDVLKRIPVGSSAHGELSELTFPISAGDGGAHLEDHVEGLTTERLTLLEVLVRHPEILQCEACAEEVHLELNVLEAGMNLNLLGETLDGTLRQPTAFLDSGLGREQDLVEMVEAFRRQGGLEVFVEDILTHFARVARVEELIAPVAEELVTVLGILNAPVLYTRHEELMGFDPDENTVSDAALVRSRGQLAGIISDELFAVLEQIEALGGIAGDEDEILSQLLVVLQRELAWWRNGTGPVLQLCHFDQPLETIQRRSSGLGEMALGTRLLDERGSAAVVSRPLQHLSSITDVEQLPLDELELARVLETFLVLQRTRTGLDAARDALAVEA